MASDFTSETFINQVTSTLSNPHKDSFSFCGTALQIIPDAIQKLSTQLVDLDLSKNRINVLTPVFAQFSLLATLKLRANLLVNIPEGVFIGLTALTELDLVDNQLEAVPADLDCLSSLRKLSLTGNNLATLPPAITRLANLQELLVGENQLTELPDDINALPKLEKLDAQENRLTRLPSTLTLCTSLQSLAVHENQITSLPPEMWKLEGLRALHLHENPLDETLVPSKLLFKRAKAILSYLQAIHEGRADDAAEILEYSVNVPVRQKSTSRLASPKGPAIDSRSQVASQPQPTTPKNTSTTPRADQPGSEIPSGIVSRAANSLRASVSAISKDEHQTVNTPRPRPSRPSVLSRAPTQITEADAASAAATPSPGTRARPQSVAVPLKQPLTPHTPPSVPPKPATKMSTPSKPQRQASDTAALTARSINEQSASVESSNVLENGVHETEGPRSTSPPQELNFEFAIPSESFVTDLDVVTEIFVEPEPSLTPSVPRTTRVTVEDAKPLLMREPSANAQDAAEFVFDAAKLSSAASVARLALDERNQQLVQQQQQDPTPLADDNSPFEAPTTPSTNIGDNTTAKPTVERKPSRPNAPSKKASKRAKIAIDTVEIVPDSAPKSQRSPRDRAKTRRIIDGDQAIGTPFYSTNDIVFLPRRITQVPLMRIASKAHVRGTSLSTALSWKEMFDPSNLELMPTSAYQGYATHFQTEDHINFVGEDHVDGGVLIVSLLKRAGADTDINCVIRTKDGDSTLLIPIPDKKPKDSNGWLALLRRNPEFSAAVNKRIKLHAVSDAGFPAELAEVEKKLTRSNYKIGVLYCKEGQTEEEEFLANEEGSAAFNDFLKWIGDVIPLQGWTKYDGGLDTQGNTTGTESVYTEWKDLNIMFHVSTMLPLTAEAKPSDNDDSDDGEADNRTQEKKVHIGNDIVVVVFLEGEGASTVFNPRKIISHFNHAFIVINPVRQKGMTLYRVNTIYKKGVQPCRPEIPPDSIFEQTDAFRSLLLTKTINSERSACLSEQFAAPLASLRYHTLYNLGQKYQAKSDAGCLGGCAGKK